MRVVDQRRRLEYITGNSRNGQRAPAKANVSNAQVSTHPRRLKNRIIRPYGFHSLCILRILSAAVDDVQLLTENECGSVAQKARRLLKKLTKVHPYTADLTTATEAVSIIARVNSAFEEVIYSQIDRGRGCADYRRRSSVRRQISTAHEMGMAP